MKTKLSNLKLLTECRFLVNQLAVLTTFLPYKLVCFLIFCISLLKVTNFELLKQKSAELKSLPEQQLMSNDRSLSESPIVVGLKLIRTENHSITESYKTISLCT